MSDPNADLIGFQYTKAEDTPAEETVTVLGTLGYTIGGKKEWATSYVRIKFGSGHETIANAHAVRQRKQVDG